MHLGSTSKAALFGMGMLFIGGCATVTITKEGENKLASTPTYEERKSYFLWGIVGEHDIDVKAVCGEKEARQMQSQFTFVDGLLGAVTLGIYAPRTAKVWCI